MSDFILTAAARQELDSIWQYIARDSEYYADRVEDAILETCALAASDPILGHRRRELSHRPILFLAVRRYEKYLIAYSEGSDPLAILRVLHGARSLRKAFRLR